MLCCMSTRKWSFCSRLWKRRKTLTENSLHIIWFVSSSSILYSLSLLPSFKNEIFALVTFLIFWFLMGRVMYNVRKAVFSLNGEEKKKTDKKKITVKQHCCGRTKRQLIDYSRQQNTAQNKSGKCHVNSNTVFSIMSWLVTKDLESSGKQELLYSIQWPACQQLEKLAERHTTCWEIFWVFHICISNSVMFSPMWQLKIIMLHEK